MSESTRAQERGGRGQRETCGIAAHSRWWHHLHTSMVAGRRSRRRAPTSCTRKKTGHAPSGIRSRSLESTTKIMPCVFW